MRTRLTGKAMTALLAMLINAGCADVAPVSSAAPVNDARISAQVRDAIRQAPQLQVSELSVRTSAGVVHLRGYVDEPDTVSAVAMLARSVEGVRSVSNELRLK